MVYLSVENLTKSFGERVLFENISFGIEKGQKVGLVARNGAGKSTLLRMVQGKETPDNGQIQVNKAIRVAFLDQDPDFSGSASMIDYIFKGDAPQAQAVKAYEAALEAYEADASEANQLALEKATLYMDDVKAWDFENKASQILTSLDLHNLAQPVANLSGGQKKRVALSRVLLEEADLLILDEPTNHLDLDMIEWLEEYLMRQNLSLMLVTHDRYFLDRICQEIIELDNGQIYRHKGNYAKYIENKAERESQETRETEKARNLMRKELDWVRRMPKARGTKAKYRLDAFEGLKERAAGKGATDQLEISAKMTRMGKKILEISHLNKAFGGKTIVKDFSYVFKRQEKIGIVGKNGVGKSTFLNMLTGMEKPDSGEIVTGETIVYGYYRQSGMVLNEQKRVIEVIKDIAEVIEVADGTALSASQLLQLFMFPPKSQHAPVHTLSGGERRRLYLLTVLVHNPNFLILDEPTNDLDILTLQILEDFLASFGGCVIIVSHDRYFMDKLADHLFIFEGEGVITDFNGKYSEYRAMLDEKEQAKQSVKEVPKKGAPRKEVAPAVKKRKMTYKEQQAFSLLETEIAKLESEKKVLVEELSSGITDHQRLQTISSRIEELSGVIDAKTMEWLALAELAE